MSRGAVSYSGANVASGDCRRWDCVAVSTILTPGLGGRAVLRGSQLPRADFRLKGDVLDRQAPVKVLAVMCHPTNARGREEILRHAPPSVVVPRHPDAPGAPRDLWTGRLWEKFALHRQTAALAGVLALALAQLSAFGQHGERRTLLPLAGTVLTAWHASLDRIAPADAGVQVKLGEEKIVAAYRTYRSVSHLWAAVVYGVIQGHPDLHPLSVGQLPSFLAYAEEIARLATSLAWMDGDDDLVLQRSLLWTFVLPEGMARQAVALPLSGSRGEAGNVEGADRPGTTH